MQSKPSLFIRSIHFHYILFYYTAKIINVDKQNYHKWQMMNLSTTLVTLWVLRNLKELPQGSKQLKLRKLTISCYSVLNSNWLKITSILHPNALFLAKRDMASQHHVFKWYWFVLQSEIVLQFIFLTPVVLQVMDNCSIVF